MVNEGNKQITLVKKILSAMIILTTTINVYLITDITFQHSRQFIRGLNYHILQHDSFNIYWTGQDMLNYPIQEYYQLPDAQSFLLRMISFFSELEKFVHGDFNQEQFNKLEQYLYFQYKNGVIEKYKWSINDGITTPFDLSDIHSIRYAFNQLQYLKIPLTTFYIGQHEWNILLVIYPFSESSIYVNLIPNQKISLISFHIAPVILALFLFAWLLQRQFTFELLPDYLLGSMLLLGMMLSLVGISSYALAIVDGITCLIAWLNAVNLFSRQKDYHMSLLIRKSYILVGRLFISFGPLFIAFGMFAYTCFCRYSGQFRSLHSSLISLFYICYYNMTYEQFIVTQRASPISTIFFFLFVLLFTICVYGSMLVSVFCSYVWNKREERIKEDIIANLKIQCSECNHKYKYVDYVQSSQYHHNQPLSQLYGHQHQPEQYQKAVLTQILFNRLANNITILGQRQQPYRVVMEQLTILDQKIKSMMVANK